MGGVFIEDCVTLYSPLSDIKPGQECVVAAVVTNPLSAWGNTGLIRQPGSPDWRTGLGYNIRSRSWILLHSHGDANTAHYQKMAVHIIMITLHMYKIILFSFYLDCGIEIAEKIKQSFQF